MTFAKFLTALLMTLCLFGTTNAQYGSESITAYDAPTQISLCNKCDGHRFCYPCEGTGLYGSDPCAICAGSGTCYYCAGTGRL